MLFFPRGSGKSTYVKLFEAWWLARWREQQIVCASHTQSLSDTISADVQRFVRENEAALGYGLLTEAKENWLTTTGGRYRGVGVGGAIAGARAMLAAIDDPVKDAEAADSEPQRNAVWDWYWGDLMGCLTPGAPIVIIMTRWHEDDLAGRLLSAQSEGWRVVTVPAVARDNDPIGRAPGEWLWDDDDYGYAEELKRKRESLYSSGQARVWSAQYQQEPRPPEGALFKPEKITVIDELPPQTIGSDVRAWDLAATADGGDATVGIRLRRVRGALGPRYVIVDIARFRGGPEQVAKTIQDVAWRDGSGVTIRIPQDPGQAGKQQVVWLTGQLGRYSVIAEPVSGDKATRAAPAASQINVGNFDMARAEWNAPFLAELRAFPNGREDDQVDALADAYSYLVNSGGVLVSKAALERSRMAKR
jgi:predicted phage terminase large subunit-like protein